MEQKLKGSTRIGILILLVALIGMTYLMINIAHKTNNTSINNINRLSNISEPIEYEAGQIYGTVGDFNISFKQDIVVESNEAVLNILNKNNMEQFIEIYIDSNMVYKSDKIAPNSKLESIKLNGVVSGKYDGEVYFYGLDNNDNVIKRAIANIDISVT